MIKLRQLLNESQKSHREVIMYATYVANSPANNRGNLEDYRIHKEMTLDIKMPFNPPSNDTKNNKPVIYCAPFKWTYMGEGENVDLIHIKFKVPIDELFIDDDEFHFGGSRYDEWMKMDWDSIKTYGDLESKGVKFNNPWDIAGCYVERIKPEQIVDIIFQLTRTRYFKKNPKEESEDKKHLRQIQSYVKRGSKGDLNLDNSPLTKLPDNLTRIGRDLYISDSSIEDLNNLEYVGRDLWIHKTNITELPEGLVIEGVLFCRVSSLSERFPDESSFRKYLKGRNIIIKGGMML